MRGGGSPLSISGGGIGVTGSPATGWSAIATAIDTPDTAETIFTFGVSGLTNYLTVENDATADGRFYTAIRGVGAATYPALTITGQGASDTTGNALITLRGRIGASTLATARPLVTFQNGNTGAGVLDVYPSNAGANAFLSWGTQSGALPAFTGTTGATRSIGTRAIFYKSDTASTTDMAVGTSSANVLWLSIPSTSSSNHFKLYAGATLLLDVDGGGQMQTTGGRIVKTRSATAATVTVSASTDEVIFCNVAASAAVAVTLPAHTTGARFTIKDAIGTANVGNITITPTSGLIDGAATLVINTAYGKTELVSDGTNWFTV